MRCEVYNRASSTAVLLGGVQNLDFDFEKCCSVSLSPVNVYACLVCGKYFQGRGPRTHAYTHALECGHQMFMKLDNGKASHCCRCSQTSSPPAAEATTVRAWHSWLLHWHGTPICRPSTKRRAAAQQC